MGIDGAYSYINYWYGVQRLRQVVASGFLEGARGRMSASAAAAPLKIDPYEHPYLGKHVDMLI